MRTNVNNRLIFFTFATTGKSRYGSGVCLFPAKIHTSFRYTIFHATLLTRWYCFNSSKKSNLVNPRQNNRQILFLSVWFILCVDNNVDNILPIPSFQHLFIIALCFSHLLLPGKDDLALELVLFLQRSIHPVDTPRFIQHCSIDDASKYFRRQHILTSFSNKLDIIFFIK